VPLPEQVVKGAVRQSTSLTPASLDKVREPDIPATQRGAITSTLHHWLILDVPLTSPPSACGVTGLRQGTARAQRIVSPPRPPPPQHHLPTAPHEPDGAGGRDSFISDPSDCT